MANYSAPNARDAFLTSPGAAQINDASAPMFDEKVPLIADAEMACSFCHQPQAPWEFLRPCLCEGVVHRGCLDRYRALSPNKEAMMRCLVCQFPYEVEQVPVEGCTPIAKFRLVALRDFSILIACCAGLMFLWGWVFVPLMDPTRWRDQWFPAGWNPRGIDFLCGVIFFFAMMGVVGIVSAIVRCFASVCGCCCQCCYDSGTYEHNRYAWTHDTYPYYSTSADLWLFFWFCYPYPTPLYIPVGVDGHHHHHPQSGGCGACMGCHCGGCSGGGGSNDCGAAIVVVILVLAIIGVVFCMMLLFVLFTKYLMRYNEIVHRYYDSLQYRVKDQTGRGATGGGKLDEFV